MSVMEEGKDSPKKLIITRKTAQVPRAVAESSGYLDAMNFARVDTAIPKRAPRMLRTVSSSCCAMLACTPNTSSLSASTRNAYRPPRRENGRTTMTTQQRKVDRSLARERLVVKTDAKRVKVTSRLCRPVFEDVADAIAPQQGSLESRRMWLENKRG